jgi:hypothetical protein
MGKGRLDGYVQGKYSTRDYEILGSADMLWSGWELDTAAVLIRLGDGRQVWAVLASVDVSPSDVPDVLRQRLVAYRQAITETKPCCAWPGRTTR